jgi:hypothetical protein
MMRSLSVLALAIGLAAIAAPAGAQTPAPAAPAAPKPMAYYIMQGSTIISPPYNDPQSCQKALQKIQRDPQPGKDMIVCAHRRP